MKQPFSRLMVAMTLLASLLLSACGGEPTAVPATEAPAATPTTAAAAPTDAPTAAATADTSAAATAEPSPTVEVSAGDLLPAVLALPEQIAAGRPVNITVVGMPPESQPVTLESWQAQVARFQAKYPNVTITGSDYEYAPDTFAALVAGNQVPTLFEVYLNDLGKTVDQGVAADLSAFYSANQLTDVFNSNMLDIASRDGKIYGIPRFAYAMGLGYNKAMLEEAGVTPPTTWEELATTAQALTKRDAARSGFSFITDGGNATGWQLTTIAYTFGATQDQIVASDNGAYSAKFAAGPVVTALNYVQALRWQYDVLPLENLDWATNGEALATGRTAMAVMAGDQFTWIRTTFPDVDISQFGFAPLPAGPDGKSVSLVGGNIAMINQAASADEQEAAVLFRLWQQFDPQEIQTGYELSQQDPQFVIGAPTLPMYVGEYEARFEALQELYANLPVANYQLFRDAVSSGKVGLQVEPTVAGQDYYAAMGSVVSTLLTDQSADAAAIASEAASTFQTNVLDELQK